MQLRLQDLHRIVCFAQSASHLGAIELDRLYRLVGPLKGATCFENGLAIRALLLDFLGTQRSQFLLQLENACATLFSR